MTIWMMDIMLQPAIKDTKYCRKKRCLHIKVTVKRYDNYLNGTSGSESELPEDSMSSDVIAPVLE